MLTDQLSTTEPVVILGGGLAAVSFASSLRAQGFRGQVTLVSEEDETPYDRPPLSKGFLKTGAVADVRLDLRGAVDAEWLRGVRAESLDTRRREVQLSTGRVLKWGSLILATGATPRELASLTGLQIPVLTLRTLEDARRLRRLLAPGARLVIVGAGVIGLEVAATAVGLGVDVTVIESRRGVMSRCAPPSLAGVIAERHRVHGVNLCLGRVVATGVRDGLLLDDGSLVRADLALVGVGVVANDRIAHDAGIACDDGVYVDAFGRTTCPSVWAVGDVARQRNPLSGRFERIETWSNAQGQGAATARAMIDQMALPYQEAPWYWSEQYNMRIQVVGLTAGDDEVVRGDQGDAKFSVLQLREGRVIGGAFVNNPRAFMATKRLLAASISGSREGLANTPQEADVAKILGE